MLAFFIVAYLNYVFGCIHICWRYTASWQNLEKGQFPFDRTFSVLSYCRINGMKNCWTGANFVEQDKMLNSLTSILVVGFCNDSFWHFYPLKKRWNNASEWTLKLSQICWPICGLCSLNLFYLFVFIQSTLDKCFHHCISPGMNEWEF